MREKHLLYFLGAGLGTVCGYPDTIELNNSFKERIKRLSSDKKERVEIKYNDILDKYPSPGKKIDIEMIYTLVNSIRDLKAR